MRPSHNGNKAADGGDQIKPLHHISPLDRFAVTASQVIFSRSVYDTLSRLHIAGKELSPGVDTVLLEGVVDDPLTGMRIGAFPGPCNRERMRYARMARQFRGPFMRLSMREADLDNARHGLVGEAVNPAHRQTFGRPALARNSSQVGRTVADTHSSR